MYISRLIVLASIVAVEQLVVVYFGVSLGHRVFALMRIHLKVFNVIPGHLACTCLLLCVERIYGIALARIGPNVLVVDNCRLDRMHILILLWLLLNLLDLYVNFACLAD